jgi:hypothetical protein
LTWTSSSSASAVLPVTPRVAPLKRGRGKPRGSSSSSTNGALRASSSSLAGAYRGTAKRIERASHPAR